MEHHQYRKGQHKKSRSKTHASLPLDPEVEKVVDLFSKAFNETQPVSEDPLIRKYALDLKFQKKVVSRFKSKYKLNFADERESWALNLEHKLKTQDDSIPADSAVIRLFSLRKNLNFADRAFDLFMNDRGQRQERTGSLDKILDRMVQEPKYFKEVKQGYQKIWGRDLEIDFSKELEKAREKRRERGNSETVLGFDSLRLPKKDRSV